MTIQHPVFCRVIGKQVLVMTVVDMDVIGMDKNDSDTFFIATTSQGNPYTGMNSTITFDRNSKVSSEKYVDIVNKANNNDSLEDTKGNSLTGIAKGTYWFTKRFKTAMDLMF